MKKNKLPTFMYKVFKPILGTIFKLLSSCKDNVVTKVEFVFLS